MYLSRLILNVRSAQVHSELARPYEMHRTLLRAFAIGGVHIDRGEEIAAGVLFRMEQAERENGARVLVQSRARPDWAILSTNHDRRGQPYLGEPPACKEFQLIARAGEKLAFRLRANPTKRRKSDGKRVGLYNEDEQLAWLERKGREGGFSLLRVTTGRDERIVDQAPSEDSPRELEFFGVQFEGVLQVLDADSLVRTVECGVGSGKAFGFGLLSLARL